MRSARVLLVLALTAASVGSAVDAAEAKVVSPKIGVAAHSITKAPAATNHGIFKKVIGKKQPSATAVVASKTLKYYGGKIIQNVKVVQVLYGAGTYAPYVAATGQVPRVPSTTLWLVPHT